jgi:macrolide-specific efflux system membrane fusion protein
MADGPPPHPAIALLRISREGKWHVNVIRKWVFPILRLLIFTAIAVALVKVAFFADTPATSADPASPSGTIAEPQYTVAIGSVTNDVKLTGTVTADPAVPIKATLAGEVRKLLIAQGQHVEVGTPILSLRAEVPNPDGTMAVKTATVTSPSAGTLSSLSSLVGQTFAVGDTVGQVAPPTFNVSGSLPPEQLYRLLNQPTEAQVTITNGPAPFACTGLTISSPLAGAGSTGEDGEAAAAASGSPTVRCAVPPTVTVFSGLAAKLVIAGGSADNVLVVPTTAVEGTAGTGNVYAVLPDGSTEPRPVTLGLNDGTNVQVLTGVAEGDVVLQFVPGADAVPPDGCQANPDGSTVCPG